MESEQVEHGALLAQMEELEAEGKQLCLYPLMEKQRG